MSSPTNIRLQPLTRAKLAALGEEGTQWHRLLPSTLQALAARWSLTIGRGLPGGSASYVTRVRTAAGEDRVLKVAIPGHPLRQEARVLASAAGVGYATFEGYDAEHDAILMESLGTGLQWRGWSPERTLEALADTLVPAWRVPLETAAQVRIGVDDKATALRNSVGDRWQQLGRPCPGRVIDQALLYADRRATALTQGRWMVVHGDPHPANALQVLSPRLDARSGFLLVDPDGFRCDQAYDLGVVLRDWCSQLIGQDPRAVLGGYCALLAQRSGLDAQAIWEWGYLERVSTGLYVMGFGAERLGRPFLETAERLLD